MIKNSELVYSTDSQKRRCPECGKYECQCPAEKKTTLSGQVAKLYIDKKGRKGKSVTVVDGLSVNPAYLAEIARSIKQKIGTGGTAKQGRIEIQGDHLGKVKELLSFMGVKVR